MTNKENVPVVVGIGEVLWDILPEGRRLGEAPANFAYHSGQQGMDSYAVSAVGQDADGQAILEEFRPRGLSTDYLAAECGYPTGTVTVELKDGMPFYQIHSPVAWDFIPWDERLVHRRMRSASAPLPSEILYRHRPYKIF